MILLFFYRIYGILFEYIIKDILINKANFILITLAVLVSLIFGSPHILIPILQGNGTSYTPLVSGLQYVCGITHDEALFYGAQIKKIFDGKPFFADVDLYEYRDTPNPFSTFSCFVLGNIAKLLGSVENLFIAADFIFPPLIFYSSYLLLLSLTGEILVAVFGSVFLIFGFDSFRTVAAIIKSNSGYKYAFWNFPLNNPLSFSRFISPEFHLPFLFFALYFLFRGIKEKSYFYSVCSGLFLGILFHSYLYFWTFYLSGCFVLLACYLFKKDFRKIKFILPAVLTGVIISIPYFIKQIEFNSFVNHNDILVRFGLVNGRFLEWHHTIQGFIAILVLAIFCKKKMEEYYFLISFMAGGLICLNLQLLTGKTIQNHHWYFLTIQPWFVLIFSFLISSLIKKKESLKTILKLLVIIFILTGAVRQVVYVSRTYNTYTLSEEEKALFTWLKENTERDDVVLSLNRRVDDLIPVYTTNCIFLPNGVLTFASDKEIIERLIIAFKLYGVKEEFLRENLPKDEWGFHLFHSKYAEVFYGKRNNFPKEILSEILIKYQYLNPNMLARWLKKYRLDYIYVGTFENSIIGNDFGKNLVLKEVFKTNNNRIYKVMYKN